jgi:hypothetical protein
MFFSGFHQGRLGDLRRYARIAGKILERYGMNIRRIAAAATFATGAAVALAPLAQADTPITTTVDSEIASLNSIFESQATIAGVPAADYLTTGTTPGVFDTVLPADAPNTTDPAQLTSLDYELFGVNPVRAGTVTDPGSYNDFNGALGKFDDAYNVYLYAAQNNGAMDLHDADFIGSPSSIDYAQTLGVTGAEQYYLNFAVGDLEGYYGIFAPATSAAADGAAAVPAATDPVASIFDSEVSAENSLFQFDALLAGDSNDITVATTPGVFDTFKTPTDLATDAPHLTAGSTEAPTSLEYLIYGANPIEAGISTGTGPFNEINGALSEFYNAFNVESYSLLGGTGTIPVGDLFGDPTALAHLLGEGTSTAVTSFLTTGFGDLEGFFGIFTSGM